MVLCDVWVDRRRLGIAIAPGLICNNKFRNKVVSDRLGKRCLKWPGKAGCWSDNQRSDFTGRICCEELDR